MRLGVDARQAGSAERDTLGDEGLQGLQRGLCPEPDPEDATTLAYDAEGAEAQALQENGPAQE